MDRFSFCAAVAVLVSCAQGIPVKEPRLSPPALSNLPGFDPNAVNLQAPKVLAEGVGININDILAHSNVTSTAASPGLDKRLIGPDNRYQYTNQNDYPWRLVGRVQWDSGVYCTGALVGPRHVLTAKHCIPGDGTGVTFYPGYDNGAGPAGKSGLYKYTYPVGYPTDNGCDTEYDFGVIILQNYLGNNLGWFGTSSTGGNNYNQAIFETLGYPSDRSAHGQRPFRQDNNKLPNPVPGGFVQESCQTDHQGPIFSDTDAASGQSGSPLWVDKGSGPQIYGVLSSGNSDATGWAAGLYMVNFVEDTKKNFP